MKRRIISRRELARGTFILKFEREDTVFTAGQHIMVGPYGLKEQREYSIYSGEQDDYLEILIRDVHDGYISPALHQLDTGDFLDIRDPVGYFTLPKELQQDQPVVLMATGTGIAPFHSYIRSYPNLNYQLIHGIRFAEEAYEKQHYKPGRLIICTSRENNTWFKGRITDYIKQHQMDTHAEFYLCGNIRMIHDAFDILQQQGVSPEQLHAEVYF